jgi:hypothetical protein
MPRVAPASTNQERDFTMIDADGVVTGLTATDFTVVWWRDGGADTSSAGVVSSQGSHVDYGVYERSGGVYSVQLPDALYAIGAGIAKYRVTHASAEMAGGFGEVKLDAAPLATLGATAPAGWINAAAIAASALNDKGNWPSAAEIETALVNDGDATALLTAIADKIAGDLTAGDLTAAAIASAVRTNLAAELARLDVAVGTRSSHAAPAEPLDAVGIRAALGVASANLDTQLSTIDDVVDAIKLRTDAMQTKGESVTATPAPGGGDPVTFTVEDAPGS